MPFPLLSDREKSVLKEYDVLKPIVGLITRTVLVIDRDMNVIYRQTGSPPMAEVLNACASGGQGE